MLLCNVSAVVEPFACVSFLSLALETHKEEEEVMWSVPIRLKRADEKKTTQF